MDRAGPPDFAPQTEHLKRSLASWLWTQCKSSPDTATRVGKLLDVPNLHCSKDECEFVERCSSASLDRLAEVCTWNSDRRSVCKVLRIECFTTLVPRPAHRYVAYLVREGLVDEVVTTNCGFGSSEPQYQLLRTHYAEGESDLRVGLRHVVTGIHAGSFPDPRPRGHGTTDNRLDADRFWFGVYLAAMRGLVERYCEPPFPFYAWLARRSAAPAREVLRLRRWLYPMPCNIRFRNGGTAPSASTFGRLVALFRPTAAKRTPGGWPYTDVGSGPMLLWVWLAAIRGSPDPGCWDHDWYLPLRDACPSPGGGGLNVRVRAHTGGDDAQPFDVGIVEQGAPNLPGNAASANANRQTTLCYQLAVTSRLAAAGVRIGRWERADSIEKHQVRPLRTGRFVRLPVQEVDFADGAQENSGGERQTLRTIHAIRLAAARLLPRTGARLTRRAPTAA